MKHITSIIIATLVLASCAGLDQKKIVTAIAKGGMAYAESTGKITPANKVYVEIAYTALVTGKLDKATLVTVAKEVVNKQLSKNLTDEERTAVMAALTSIEAGNTDMSVIIPLAKSVLEHYASQQGIPPAEAAAIIALAEAFTP